MKIYTKNKEFEMEMNDLLNLFEKNDEDQIEIFHEEEIQNNHCVNSFTITEKGRSQTFSFKKYIPSNLTLLKQKSFRKRVVRNNLYEILSKGLTKKLPWGSLTGIRPVKLARDLIENEDVKPHLISEFLTSEFKVCEEKAQMVSKILKNQKCIIRNDNLVDFYVNIPICPSRCNYCSFISNEYSKVENLIEPYIDCVIKEIQEVKKIIFDKALIVRNIYVGGGTPSVLNESQLSRLLKELSFPVNEFTVECGRPETITYDKLKILKENNVTRISVNPQTFCDATLRRIGRGHKVNDVFEAYAMALEFGFVVNMDIILGLDGENKAIFTKTIKTLLELSPENVTIHTLSLKRGSKIQQDMDKNCQVSLKKEWDISKSLSEAESKLMQCGYQPYYLYRQKNQLGGLENVGFCKDDKVCVFNVGSMEETTSIIAVGANAASKRVFNFENRIERSFNHKFINDYIDNIDEMIERKKDFFN